MPVDERQERIKAIEVAVGQIEKQFGKGSIMRLGQRNSVGPIAAISTGSISIVRYGPWRTRVALLNWRPGGVERSLED